MLLAVAKYRGRRVLVNKDCVIKGIIRDKKAPRNGDEDRHGYRCPNGFVYYNNKTDSMRVRLYNMRLPSGNGCISFESHVLKYNDCLDIDGNILENNECLDIEGKRCGMIMMESPYIKESRSHPELLQEWAEIMKKKPKKR